MKNFLKSIAAFGLSLALFNCSNSNEPAPMDSAQQIQKSAAQHGNPEEGFAGNNPGAGTIDQGSISSRSGWKLVKALTLQPSKGFNLSSPYAITSELDGDVSWDEYGCYYALKPLKVSFNNLKIVSIPSLSQGFVKSLAYNKTPIANAPDGSTSWTNYMPVKTVIAAKTAAGKYYLLEIAADNPLQINIYQWSILL